MTLVAKKVTKTKQVREGDLVLVVHEGRSDEGYPGFSFGPVDYVSATGDWIDLGIGSADLDEKGTHVFRFRNKEED